MHDVKVLYIPQLRKIINQKQSTIVSHTLNLRCTWQQIAAHCEETVYNLSVLL